MNFTMNTARTCEMHLNISSVVSVLQVMRDSSVLLGILSTLLWMSYNHSLRIRSSILLVGRHDFSYQRTNI